MNKKKKRKRMNMMRKLNKYILKIWIRDVKLVMMKMIWILTNSWMKMKNKMRKKIRKRRSKRSNLPMKKTLKMGILISMVMKAQMMMRTRQLWGTVWSRIAIKRISFRQIRTVKVIKWAIYEFNETIQFDK